MTSLSKTLCAQIASVALNVLAFGFFVLLCWTAAADAQGAIALFLYAPVLAFLLTGAFFLGRYAASGNKKSLGHFSKRTSQVFAIFLLVFYISPAIGLSGFSSKVIGFVANSFEAFTGKTPMQWDKNN